MKEMVFNEPRATGWLRTDLLGDVDKAKGYVQEARKMLGSMRTLYGVNQRIADGEPGGFYRSSRLLGDGSTIEVITNDGQDNIRITTARPTTQQREEAPSHFESSSQTLEPGGHSFMATHEDPTTPLPNITSETWEESEEEEQKKIGPYMWVGVRVNYDKCRAHWSACTPIMIEPDTGKTRGILQNGSQSTGWYGYLDVEIDADNKVTRAKYEGSDQYIDPYDNLTGAIANFNDSWGGIGQPRKRLEDHCLQLAHIQTGYPSERAFYFFTANGLRQYSSFGCRSATPEDEFSPYDPLMTDEQNHGQGRDFSGLIDQPFYTPGKYGWDEVFVLDPYEDEGDEPVDSRPKVINTSEYLQTIGMASGETQVLSGEYLLSIMAYDSTDLASDRTGQEIPGLGGAPYLRSSVGDYIEHMVDTAGITPMQCEIEIRLGKGEDMVTYNYETTIEEYSYGESWTTPFGFYGPDAWVSNCSGAVGYNSFGPNYSHPIIAIDVMAGTVRLSDEIPEPVLGGGHFDRYGDSRSTLDIYICGDYFPMPSDADFPSKAAAALFTSLEGITSGVFGFSFVSETTVSELQSVLAGIHTGSVWRYDPVAKSITELPIVSSTTDYDYTNTWFHEWWYWYYPYLGISKMACHNSFAILINSTPSFVYNGEQSVAQLGLTPNCC